MNQTRIAAVGLGADGWASLGETIAISQAEPIGGFTGWRAQLPVVPWSLGKAAP